MDSEIPIVRMNMAVIELTDANFDTEVAEGLPVVDFWAT
jgi:hypothetical protein